MSAIRTDHLLQELQQKIAVVKRKAEIRFNGQSTTNLQQQPGPGKWSAVQCLEHLNTYGRYYLPALDQAIKKAEKKVVVRIPLLKAVGLVHTLPG